MLLRERIDLDRVAVLHMLVGPLGTPVFPSKAVPVEVPNVRPTCQMEQNVC